MLVTTRGRHRLAPILENLYVGGRFNGVNLFGTSGIRGQYPTEVDETLFLSLGSAVATLYEDVLVGRDVRDSGLPLQAAFMAGVAAGGASVYDCGIVATPTVAHLAARFDCGGIVTASHNPPEYNGLKLWSPSGMAFDQALRSEVEEAMKSEPSYGGWQDVGQVFSYGGALEEHREKILAAVDPSDVRVAVDCGNGAASLLTPFVLRDMGCRVLALHSQPDGAFPGRGAEPREETLGDLRKAVPQSGCDLGVAHDGDGDRMVAVDEEGSVVKGEKLLILFSRFLGARSIVAPVDASMVLEDVLGKDRVIRTRVGDVFVAESVLREDADLGGEASGTWIFPDFALCPDGIYAAAYLCALLQEGSLVSLVEDVPDYPILRDSIPYVPAQADNKKLEEALVAMDVEEVSRLDGWRLDFGDAWALVRPSGTEPKMRVTVEAREEDRAREIYAALHSKVSRAIR